MAERVAALSVELERLLKLGNRLIWLRRLTLNVCLSQCNVEVGLVGLGLNGAVEPGLRLGIILLIEVVLTKETGRPELVKFVCVNGISLLQILDGLSHPAHLIKCR